jgi:DASH complex subunit ASK1
LGGIKGASDCTVWDIQALTLLLQFWKQFFEASANVSLSSYEEPGEGQDATTTVEETEATAMEGQATLGPANMTATQARPNHDEDGSSMLDSPSLQHTTPRRPAADEPSFAEYPSPYETLKQEMTSTTTTRAKANKGISTPGQKAPTFLPPEETPDPQSSPFLPMSARQIPGTARNAARQNPDPLLHRVLDKNYRIQATPHTTRRTSPSKPAQMRDPLLDSSPYSPQLAAPPQLRAEIFGTPVARRGAAKATAAAPRTPGISVQNPRGLASRGVATPAQAESPSDSTRRTLFSTSAHKPALRTPEPSQGVDDYDSEIDTTAMEGGTEVSPPKTLQFHVPLTATRANMLQTPAREASRRIVEDLLLTAGGKGGNGLDDVTSEIEGLESGFERGEEGDGGGFWDDEDEGYGDEVRGVSESGRMWMAREAEDSPSVVRVTRGDEDDTF